MNDDDAPTTPEVRDSFDWYDRNQADPMISTADFDRWLAVHDAEVAAGALREAADAWQTGGWANGLPKGADRVALILGMAQGTITWLRARADALVRP